MLFYDFEVFKYDWLVVLMDMASHNETVIHNDRAALQSYYESHKQDIWAGYNNKHYDQYILKGILLGMNPKEINDRIITLHQEGWQISSAFNKIKSIQYDVMPKQIGLKALEAFMGSDIRETEVPFDIDRPLTKEELEQTIYYCRHDVEETIKVFLHTIDNFNAMKGIVDAFPEQVSLFNIGDTEARITAKVLGCQKHDWTDEFDFEFLPCIKLKKYKYVLDWFKKTQREAQALHLGEADKWTKKRWYDAHSLDTVVAGVPHHFSFGGLHGAPEKPVHYDESDGAGYHVDVNNYYPSELNAWDLTTRSRTNDNYMKIYNTRKSMKAKQQECAVKGDKAGMKVWKKKQLPHKKMLNALSGAMKDETNPAYDPRNNNAMCINGQLMLLDLIEHLEVIPGFRLIQSNTDGLIIWIPDTDDAFYMMDDICYEWESRCSTDKCDIKLALDCIREIFQKDVNNYLWIAEDGSIERIGAYIKELSPIDNDFPILNKALVDYMSQRVPVEQTISQCNDLYMFQHVVKLSAKYSYVEHEEGHYEITHTGKRVIKTHYEYPNTRRFTNKCYRVFASRDPHDGRLLKCGGSRGKPEKFADTSEHCFVWNESTDGVRVPDKLDRDWYITKAKKRLKDYGIS